MSHAIIGVRDCQSKVNAVADADSAAVTDDNSQK